jgi:hypothetical protein
VSALCRAAALIALATLCTGGAATATATTRLGVSGGLTTMLPRLGVELSLGPIPGLRFEAAYQSISGWWLALGWRLPSDAPTGDSAVPSLLVGGSL